MTELEKAADRRSFLYGKILDNQDWDISELDELLDLSRKDGIEWQAKQSPWISVEERFPENKETVLVSSQIDGKIVLAWDELGMAWLYPESEDVYCDWDNVDCWMPIPETP